MDTFKGFFPRVPDPTEVEVRQLLEPHYPVLWQTVMLPWRDLQERREADLAFRRKSGKHLAWWLHSEMREQAKELFAGHLVLRPETLKNKVLALRYRDKLLITIKKVHKCQLRGAGVLKRSNILTPTNKDYHDQRSGKGFPDIPRVVLGYRLMREETEIEIVIAYPRSQDHNFLWHYLLPDQSAGELRLDRRPSDGPPEESPTKGFTIAPKKSAKDSRKT